MVDGVRRWAHLPLLPGLGGRGDSTGGDGVEIGGLWWLGRGIKNLLVCVGGVVVVGLRWSCG